MEDQGKRLVLAVVLCMGILLVGTWLFGPKTAPQPTAQTPSAAGQAPTAAPVPGAPVPVAGQPGATSQPTVAGAPGGPGAPAAVPAKARGPEQKVVLSTAKVDATFSSYGGALSGWTLKGDQYTTEIAGKRAPMDLVRTGDNPLWYALQVAMPESTLAVDPNAEWTLEKKSDHEVVATWRSDELEVVKDLTLLPDDYAIGMTVSVRSLSAKEAVQRVAIQVDGYQDPTAKTPGRFSYAEPPWTASCFTGGKSPKSNGWSTLKEGEKSYVGEDVRWAGMETKYFLFAIGSAPSEKGEQLKCGQRNLVQGRDGVMQADLTFAPITFKPGDPPKSYKTIVYAGPKQVDLLEKVSGLLGEGKDLRFGASVSLGFFAFIARPMLWLLKVFHGFVGNWGVAIILLTLTVKLLTLYWTTKSMRSMKAMSRLKPKLDLIREKFPDDKNRQNVETMNLYKANNINPLGGCLPMLLQMPVWFALYSTLGAAAELYQAPFVGWVHNLTAPDPYYIFPAAVTLMMFLQAKLQPAAVDSQQQKMMMYMMPAMFGFFSLAFPVGLSIYIFTNTLLTMLHQLWMNSTEPPMPVEPAAAKAVTGGGGGGGGKKSGGNKAARAKA